MKHLCLPDFTVQLMTFVLLKNMQMSKITFGRSGVAYGKATGLLQTEGNRKKTLQTATLQIQYICNKPTVTTAVTHPYVPD